MRVVSIIEAMVIDMNEAQVRTLEQVRQVVAGTQALEFRRAEDDEGRYGWIEQVLRRFEYRRLGRADKGAVLAYVQHLSGYSRAQLTRLVSRWMHGKPLVKNYRRPEHAFARRYTAADVALLAEVDRAMGTLSGPATACVLRRQRDVFKDARFERLGDISVGHLYNLRNSAAYRAQRVVLTKTRPTRGVDIGVRKAPAPRDARASSASTASTRATRTASRACTTSTRWTASRSGKWWPQCRPSPRRTCCPSSSRCSNSSRSRSWGSTPTTAASTSTTGWPRCWTS